MTSDSKKNLRRMVAGTALAVLVPLSADAQHNPVLEQLRFQGRLVGRDILDRTGDNIGRITDVVLAPNGAIDGVLIAVGDALALGEHKVAVPAQQIVWRDNVLYATDLTRQQAERLPRHPEVEQGGRF